MPALSISIYVPDAMNLKVIANLSAGLMGFLVAVVRFTMLGETQSRSWRKRAGVIRKYC
jgi:hypothetical protein